MVRSPLPPFAAVVQAYEIVFRRTPTLGEIATLHPEALKRVYRERAATCHPDRAASTGVSSQALQAEFVAVQQAHQLLLQWVREWSRAAAEGPLPQVGRHDGGPQRFGDYLSATGAVDRGIVQMALLLQRLERPRFGELCVALGALTPAVVGQIVLGRLPNEPIASAAVRLGWLSYAAAQQILQMQSSYQRPLGEILVTFGVLSHRELKRRLRHHQKQLTTERTTQRAA